MIRFVRRIERSVRTGATVRHAFDRSLDEAPIEIGHAFERTRLGLNLGQPLPDALRACARDAPDNEIAQVATLLAFIATDPRGAASGLGSMAQALQATDDLEQERRALIAQAETSARMLVALPFVAVAFGLLSGQAAALGLFTTSLGRLCLAVGVVLDLVGAWWMARIIARAAQ